MCGGFITGTGTVPPAINRERFTWEQYIEVPIHGALGT